MKLIKYLDVITSVIVLELGFLLTEFGYEGAIQSLFLITAKTP